MAKTKNKKKINSEYVSLKKGKANAKKTLNPFEVHINKEKLKVLGKKQKNDKGLPGVSRAKAIKKRKSTLLQEYKQQNKSNKFLDKRIGEKNFNMSEEDRTMARFTAVRLKENKKKSIFNLADDEVLTHRGQTLTEIEKFDDPRSDDEDSLENKGNLESDFVEEAHFGGGLLKKTGIEGAKSHKDIIEQLIAESKKRKAEQQKNKEATLELTEKLDSEWKDLGSLVHRPGKSEKEPDIPQNTTKTDVDDYDKVMRELRFEARGTVSDRLKTQDEMAVEEKEKLEQLEKERLERMKGDITEKFVTNNHRSADDLDDDIVYENDPDYVLSYNQEGESNVIVEATVEKINEENDEENKKIDSNENRDDGNDAEESDNEQMETDSEDNLSDLRGTESESEDEIEEDKNVQNDDEKTVDTFEEVPPSDLPYTFSMPDSYESLQTLLENHTDKEQGIIIERMIKCNHPSLAEGNKDKLGLLFAYLLQYINDLFSDCNDKVTLKKHFQILNCITGQIYDLAKLNPENVYTSMLEVIKEKHAEFKENSKKYPGLEVMIFFQLINILFTTSDFRHQIVTPSFIFMEQMLNKCKVKNKRDISFGLFLVTLILNYTLLSKRFFPAAVNFLCGLLHSAIPKGGVKLIKVLPPFKSISTLLVLLEDHSINICPSFKMDVSDLINNTIDEEYKIRAVSTTLELLKNLFNQYKNYSSSFEIFQPALKYIESIPIKKYPKEVAASCNEFVNLLNESRTKRPLQYLVQESSKPKALRLYEPKIMEVYDGKRHKVQSKEKAERAKLLHKVKQERKGALREIRRDNAFLARVKIQQQVQSDKHRREKVKKLYAEAASQQSELNALDRKKKNKK